MTETTTTTTTVAERVQAGTAWLDEHDPGWVDRIDLDRLDINTECQCILGQLHGSYKAAPPVQVAAYEGGSHYGVLAWAIPLGFGMDWPDCRDNGRRLTEAWRELIAARRVDRAVANLRAAREPAYDPTDPIQAAAVERLRSEADAEPEQSPGERFVASVERSHETHRQAALPPAEVFGNAEELAVWLARAAEAYGLEVDRQPGTLAAQTVVARLLLEIMLPDRDPTMDQAAEAAGRMALETAGGQR